MTIEDLLKDKRDEILRIAAMHGASNVRVFGSAARGEAREDSDVDFLVVMESDHTPFFPGGLIMDLEELLGCKVDVVTMDGLHWYVKDEIVKEAVPV